jgi:hypothetical protein
MLENVRNSIDAHPLVRNAIIVALWLPLVLVLNGAGVALLGLAWYVARTGDVSPLIRLFAGVDRLAALAVGGFIAYLYLVLANATFGTEDVDAALDQAQEASEEVR